jgi:hypothetical protein
MAPPGRPAIFTSEKQKIIGIRTDFRRVGESEGAVVSAMIEGAYDWIAQRQGRNFWRPSKDLRTVNI